MQLYHFVSKKWGLQNIRLRRLKIATLDQLNDPFEMLSMSLEDQQIRQAMINTKDEMAKRKGLLCFSQRWQNPVQWSHYAEKHSGLCLQFEVSDHLVTPVIYEARRLYVDHDLLEADGQRLIEKVICTKFNHWRYEKESRLFVTLEDKDIETGYWFKNFCPDMSLTGVIVGATSSITRQDVTEALGDICKDVFQRKARLSFRRFSVVTQNRADLWS